MLMWKIVERSETSVLYIYIYIYIDDTFLRKYCVAPNRPLKLLLKKKKKDH